MTQTSISHHIAVVDGTPTTTTQDIAEVYGRRHDDVLRIVRQRMTEAGEWGARNFAETVTTRANPSGGAPLLSPVIRMTKKGFMFAVGKFTGVKAVQHQIAYADEFERMEKALEQQGTALQTVKDPVLAAHIRTLIEVDAIKTEQQRQAIELSKLQETLAVVEARTQPENKHFTVMGWANLQGQKVDIGLAARIGRKCAELSRDQGISIGDVSDPRFGKVHSYHETILQAVFDNATQAA